MNEVTSFEYNMDNRSLELYDAQGELVRTINPLKVIKEMIEPKACYLVPNDQEVIVFNKIGQDICNVNIWEIINIHTDKLLTETLHQRYIE